MRKKIDENKILPGSSFHEAGPMGHALKPLLLGQNNKASSKLFSIPAGEGAHGQECGKDVCLHLSGLYWPRSQASLVVRVWILLIPVFC